MQHFAAYDWNSIHSVDTDPDAALVRAQKSPDAGHLRVATISSELADFINRNGWNSDERSFEIFDGEIIDITGDQAFRP